MPDYCQQCKFLKLHKSDVSFHFCGHWKLAKILDFERCAEMCKEMDLRVDLFGDLKK